MNRNSLGVAKINDLVNNYIEEPTGFVVREKVVDGKPVTLEYGIYLNSKTFLSVPLHFSLKGSLISTPNANTNEYNYYLVPQNMQFAVSTYTSKRSGKVNPILVAPTENNPAVFISCLAFGDALNLVKSVINVETDENTKVVRKYIDKDRRLVGLILMNTNTDVINPTTTVTIKHGTIGSNVLNVDTYTFNPVEAGGFTKVSDTTSTEHPVKTEFIKLTNFIEPEVKEESKEVSESSNVNVGHKTFTDNRDSRRRSKGSFHNNDRDNGNRYKNFNRKPYNKFNKHEKFND